MIDVSNITQEEIARRVGADQSRVSRWLSGDRIPRTGTMRRLAEAMGLSVEELAGQIYRNRIGRESACQKSLSPHSE